MNRYSLSHLDRPARLRVLHERNTTARVSTADLIAAIAECDAQKDYLPEGHPSMLSYCIHELALQEEAASKRNHAARAAREFPAIFEALADGRLHLSAVVLLAPHLRPENSDELLCAAAHRSKSEIVKLLRERLARIDVPNLPQVVAAASSEHAPGRVENEVPAGQPVSGQLMTPLARSAPGVENKSRTLMRLMIDEDKLRSARDLLTHRLPSGNASDIVDFALAELIAKRTKRKFGAGPRRRMGRVSSSNPRHIPAHIRHEVYERDGSRCTFTSETGRRCPAVSHLEFDHIQEIARGGTTTAANLRLRCRAHNQYTAELTYGAEFMKNKREEARSAARREQVCASTRVTSASRASALPLPSPIAADMEPDVVAALRTLGYRAEAIRRAVLHCGTVPCATLEDLVRTALTFLRPGARTEDFRPIERRSSAA